MLCGLIGFFNRRPYSDEIVISLSLLGGLLFPGLLTTLFGKKVRERFAFFVLSLIASGVFTLVLGMLSGSLSNKDFLWFFVWNPFVLMLMQELGGFSKEGLVAAGVVVNALYFVVLLIKAFQAFRPIREIERALAE